MDKAAILCKKDKAMLQEFSRRVILRVTGRSLPAFRIPFLGAYIDANVMKEVEKDRIVICHAAEAFAAGKRADDMDSDALFEETKTVDRTFVKSLIIPSLSVRMRYEDIAGIRKTRIRLLVHDVHHVLRGWDDASSFEERLRSVYAAEQFKEAVIEILHLFNLETRMLSRSTRFFPPFRTAMKVFADTLFDVMEAVARELADDYAIQIYQRAPSHVTA
jgi:hypothetical protein